MLSFKKQKNLILVDPNLTFFLFYGQCFLCQINLGYLKVVKTLYISFKSLIALGFQINVLNLKCDLTIQSLVLKVSNSEHLVRCPQTRKWSLTRHLRARDIALPSLRTMTVSVVEATQSVVCLLQQPELTKKNSVK